jgi:hypothetical protein
MPRGAPSTIRYSGCDVEQDQKPDQEKIERVGKDGRKPQLRDNGNGENGQDQVKASDGPPLDA